MKAYNTPKDELHIESDTGETLVSITSDKTTIANLEGAFIDTSDDTGYAFTISAEQLATLMTDGSVQVTTDLVGPVYPDKIKYKTPINVGYGYFASKIGDGVIFMTPLLILPSPYNMEVFIRGVFTLNSTELTLHIHQN